MYITEDLNRKGHWPEGYLVSPVNKSVIKSVPYRTTVNLSSKPLSLYLLVSYDNVRRHRLINRLDIRYTTLSTIGYYLAPCLINFTYGR